MTYQPLIAKIRQLLNHNKPKKDILEKCSLCGDGDFARAFRRLEALDFPDQKTYHQIYNLCRRYDLEFPSALDINTKEKALQKLSELTKGSLC